MPRTACSAPSARPRGSGGSPSIPTVPMSSAATRCGWRATRRPFRSCCRTAIALQRVRVTTAAIGLCGKIPGRNLPIFSRSSRAILSSTATALPPCRGARSNWASGCARATRAAPATRCRRSRTAWRGTSASMAANMTSTCSTSSRSAISTWGRWRTRASTSSTPAISWPIPTPRPTSTMTGCRGWSRTNIFTIGRAIASPVATGSSSA